MNKIKSKETLQENPSESIRKATIEDIPEMARINAECWKHNYKGIIAQNILDAISVEEKKVRWTSNFEERQKTAVMYVKEIDGKIAGFIGGSKNNDATVPYENEITMVYVDVAQQGKKIGKELFERLLEDEKFVHCASFFLRTLRDNMQSNSFYKKMGGKMFGYKEHKSGAMEVGYYRQK
ncbi:MAG: GNAT family N-acetyltransferase [candidate division SR1 bacterium]|nr:GNAT family N-acetyltransferase [candidate division SR1 bacterium]